MESESLAREATTKLLYEAALEGNVESLRNLLQEDPHVLDRCMIEKSGTYMQSPLHVATNKGHSLFVAEILREKPELAEMVDQLKKSSPLHLASSKQNLDIIHALLSKKPNMCLAHDREGMTPIHVAAVYGTTTVLEILLHENFHAARERTKGGETALHLCVKHNRMDSLEFLLNLRDDEELLNSLDNDGNTALHLAVIGKQNEMVKSLLQQKKIEKNAINKRGLTALDIHMIGGKMKVLCCKQAIKWDPRDQLGPLLEREKALQAKHALKIQNRYKWVEKQGNALMVAASLIAAMAFQFGLSPPGGFWQDDDNGHIAGIVILEKYRAGWNVLVVSNTMALASSFSVILLLISGLPYGGRLFVGILRITMWIAVSATTLTYGFSVMLSTGGISITMPVCALIAWICLIGALLFKTFHFAGVASMNVTLGVPRINEIINASKRISTPIIMAKLEDDQSMEIAQIVRGQIEKTLLGQVAKSIRLVMESFKASIVIKLDMEKITSSRLFINARVVGEKILKSPKMLKDYKMNILVINDSKLAVSLEDKVNDNKNNYHFALHQLKNKLPKIIVKGMSTVERAIIADDRGKLKKLNLIVEGTGLREVMGVHGIEGSETESNHVIEVQQTLGIEAARSCIIKEIRKVMQSHSMDVDTRHMMLLADVMTSKGEILGVNRYGIAQMKESVLTLASFEKTDYHLFNGSLHGRKDEIKGVGERIIMGTPTKIGTGIIKIKQRVDPLPILRYGPDLIMSSLVK